jgi:hypothetical protein
VGRSVAAPFNSGIFSKLPHPVEGPLRGLPRVSGLEVEQLLVFLTEVIPIRDLSMLTDSQVLELMFPHCQDALASKVVAALLEGWTFERLHREVLEFFIPRRLLNICDVRGMKACRGRRNRSRCIFVPSKRQRGY